MRSDMEHSLGGTAGYRVCLDAALMPTTIRSPSRYGG